MICISLIDLSFAECLKIRKEAAMIEVRMDKLTLQDREYKNLFETKIKTIATCRPYNRSEKECLTLLEKAIRYGADYIDIEIESSIEYKNYIIQIAKQHNVKIIISYHNYSDTPTNDLDNIISESIKEGADIVKIATKVNNPKQAAALLGLYSKYDNIVVIGMGSKGVITRVSSLLLGAPFTFASVDNKHKSAPGQLPYKTMNIIYGLIKNKTVVENE